MVKIILTLLSLLQKLVPLNVKCLGKGHIVSQCPNKRTMAVLGNGIITSASFLGSSSSSTKSESQCDVQPLKGDIFMVRRLMGSVCKD